MAAVQALPRNATPSPTLPRADAGEGVNGSGLLKALQTERPSENRHTCRHSRLRGNDGKQPKGRLKI
ncbi:hypothetical protein [Kingella potus]|uniref:hypothetical protein n=1 Tax=Kingella potus TaxID=265175 RepID=UPI001C49C0F0|nr:hypothetical protein [Kingella potus]UOP00805.1 hypothetical protein LVJ84_13815 [Kingella potus]